MTFYVNKMARNIITIFLCLSVLGLEKYVDANKLRLKQVLMLSRHNLRFPLISNLKVYTPNSWPSGNYELLSPKGVILEEIMAEYISQWLAHEDFIKGCPKEEDVLIYSNTRERTRATGKVFAESAFRNCNITGKHDKNIDIFDPIFYPIVHNQTDEFNKLVLNEMEDKLNEIDLSEPYRELNKILDIKKSENCIKNKICDLAKQKSKVVNEKNEEPNVIGPLRDGTTIVDAFLMNYYEGLPLSEVAWGKINNDSQWKLLGKIMRQNLNVRFNLTVSKDIAGPLLHLMTEIFENGTLKFIMLTGHDSNIAPIVRELGFSYFELPDTFDVFPVGGKIVFQKWTDDVRNYLKIEYVYQTAKQLRFAKKLSLDNPPRRITLELRECKIDTRGLCPWNDFMKIMKF